MPRAHTQCRFIAVSINTYSCGGVTHESRPIAPCREVWSSQCRGSACPPPACFFFFCCFTQTPSHPHAPYIHKTLNHGKHLRGLRLPQCRPIFWWGFTSLERDGMSLVQFSDRHRGGGRAQNTVHFLPGRLTGGGQRTARMASSKTVFKPRWVRAEHSRYLTEPISRAIARP